MSANHDITRFNIRVYGICIQDEHVLITDEVRWGHPMTKFPGGGLEYGEGVEDCLKREWMEELEVEIEVGDVFFANPFFLRSSFDARDQVVCIYYRVNLLGEPKGHFTTRSMDFPEDQEGDLQAFRWLPLSELGEDVFTFPSDKAVTGKLRGVLAR
jgi:ADP-ribose pyrophosphatase YjhB (NUDIX family)